MRAKRGTPTEESQSASGAGGPRRTTQGDRRPAVGGGTTSPHPSRHRRHCVASARRRPAATAAAHGVSAGSSARPTSSVVSVSTPTTRAHPPRARDPPRPRPAGAREPSARAVRSCPQPDAAAAPARSAGCDDRPVGGRRTAPSATRPRNAAATTAHTAKITAGAAGPGSRPSALTCATSPASRATAASSTARHHRSSAPVGRSMAPSSSTPSMRAPPGLLGETPARASSEWHQGWCCHPVLTVAAQLVATAPRSAGPRPRARGVPRAGSQARTGGGERLRSRREAIRRSKRRFPAVRSSCRRRRRSAVAPPIGSPCTRRWRAPGLRSLPPTPAAGSTAMQ